MNKIPRPGSERAAEKKPKTGKEKGPSLKGINVALQGGGSHGAFTWGVLDRLLEDDRIFIDGISGTSAGAMNAAVVADGLMKGGKEGARKALHDFWHAISEAARFSPIQRAPFDVVSGNWNLDQSPSYLMFDMLERRPLLEDADPHDRLRCRASALQRIE